MPTGITRFPGTLVAIAIGCLPALAVAEPAWQQSASPQVELAVRDRSPGGEHPVVFVVTGPGGREARLARRVDGDQWSQALFPRDFATDLLPGEYRWTGYVDGAAVAGGRFSYETDRRGSRLSSSW